MWSSNRHSSSRWSRTWSAAVSPATTRTSSDWPASSPATTARCSPWCSANTRKAPSTAPASTACCTSPAASTTATRPSSEYSPCATWRTSSPRATGCSRTVATAAANWAVDDGHMPRNRQVGATGTWVTARVYLAVGISGAIQHLQGIGACDKVVAVNRDAGCDMIKRADLSVIGDSTEILRALIRLAEAHRNGAARDAA
ncbi:electron transfer flavoprotein subunit alpha [Pseudomonas aeruginosa VRFPA09]|nr:electron transfer flavoprotein subunit alpha [Pseudomonas aeruginosa VRFPA09]